MNTFGGYFGFWSRTLGFGLNIAKYSRAGGFNSDWLWEGRVNSLDGRLKEVQVSVTLARINNLNLENRPFENLGPYHG